MDHGHHCLLCSDVTPIHCWSLLMILYSVVSQLKPYDDSDGGQLQKYAVLFWLKGNGQLFKCLVILNGVKSSPSLSGYCFSKSDLNIV